jgi:hypothetical protein
VGLPIKEESIIVRPVVLIVSLDVLPRLLAVLLGLRFDQSIPAEYFSHWSDGADEGRKLVSEAEKAATEISKLACELQKLVPRHSQASHVHFEYNSVIFTQSKQNNLDAEACNLTDHRQQPCYYACADFKFEASLPDRDYLTRFSVWSLTFLA